MLEQQHISQDWPAKDGEQIILSIRQKGSQARKSYALLERPMLHGIPSEEFSYKIFVSGCTRVGKTATVANLCGYSVPTEHTVTPGIQISNAYWPAKIIETEKVVLFNLAFWDAGEDALKNYDHILESCRSNVDAFLFLFAFDSKSSFDDLPKQMSRVLRPNDDACKCVLGTKLDNQLRTEVTQRDVQAFESSWHMPILKLSNRPDTSHTPTFLLSEVAPVLNSICNELWARDKLLAAARKR